MSDMETITIQITTENCAFQELKSPETSIILKRGGEVVKFWLGQAFDPIFIL